MFEPVLVVVRLGFDLVPQPGSFPWWLELGASLAFLVDVGLCFVTAYQEGATWVVSPSKIRKRYLRGWFWADALSAVPIELIALVIRLGSETAIELAWLRLLRCAPA